METLPWFTVLRVPRTSDEQTITSAYRRLATVMHPDRGGSTAAFVQLTAAYEQALEDARRRPHNRHPKRVTPRDHLPRRFVATQEIADDRFQRADAGPPGTHASQTLCKAHGARMPCRLCVAAERTDEPRVHVFA